MSLELVRANLLSPIVLAFALGFLARLVKSDLKLPNGLYQALSIYLLLAIGLKGGVALSKVSFADLWLPCLGTVGLGLAGALLGYVAARKLCKLSRVDAAAMAAHYGSVSAVTFIAAVSFAQSQNIQTEGFLPALVGLLEVPAILVAVGLVRSANSGSSRELWHELLTGRAVVLLLGGLVIGMVCGEKGVGQVQPLFGDLFKGALTIFLLEMGLVAAEQVPALKSRAGRLALYGVAVPVLNGVLGVTVGLLCGMSAGGAGVLGAMAASASYIAAPAAVRVALPEANLSLCLAASLAITFPFNLTLGIPAYQWLSETLATGRTG